MEAPALEARTKRMILSFQTMGLAQNSLISLFLFQVSREKVQTCPVGPMCQSQTAYSEMAS